MNISNIFSEILKNKSTKNYDQNAKGDNQTSLQHISPFRRYLPQILASTVKNILIFDYGLSFGFVTILIPALTGLNSVINSHEALTVTPDQATWLASITLICQPIGSISSAFITDQIGRKYALLCVNIPYLTAWILLYFASSVSMLYISFMLSGLAIGLMEAPVLTYIGEICEPCIRGILVASACIAAGSGMAIIFFLGSLTTWRKAALICSVIPIISMVLTLFMPETPHWLLYRNRQDDALKSLQWLRGWVDSSVVRTEFEELQSSQANARKCNKCTKPNEICQHPPATIRDKIRDFFRRCTLHPFLLIVILYFLAVFVGLNAFRPYLVQVLYYYQSPIDANKAIVWIGYIGLVANFVLVCIIKPLGKRKTYLWSMGIVVIILFSLGVYGFLYLSLDKTSFEINTNTTKFGSDSSLKQYFPLIAFSLLNFVGNLGVSTLPNIMISEVFPFRSRAFASGLAVIAFYFFSFIASKSFYVLEELLTLPGLTIFVGFFGVIGFIGMYFTLPDTEGRSLEEIESYFSDGKRKIYDIYIPQHEQRTSTHF